MPHRRHRKDRNQPAIQKGLTLRGIQFKNTSQQADGFPDLVVGFRGTNYLFEVKASTKDALTEDEAKFMLRWNGQVQVVTTLEEILETIGYEDGSV